MANTILIRGHAEEVGGLVASEALTPGHLVEYGGSDDIQKASGTGGEPKQPLFVREQWEREGQGIGDNIASGDTCTVLRPNLGSSTILAWLAEDEDVDEGDALSSNGDGTLQEASAGEAIIAYAAEDVDATGAPARIKVIPVQAGYVEA